MADIITHVLEYDDLDAGAFPASFTAAGAIVIYDMGEIKKKLAAPKIKITTHSTVVGPHDYMPGRMTDFDDLEFKTLYASATNAAIWTLYGVKKAFQVTFSDGAKRKIVGWISEIGDPKGGHDVAAEQTVKLTIVSVVKADAA